MPMRAGQHGTFFCHVRPRPPRDMASTPYRYQSRPPGPPSRSLSQAFGQDSTQDEVFEYAAKPIIDAVLDGYNGEGARGSACH